MRHLAEVPVRTRGDIEADDRDLAAADRLHDGGELGAHRRLVADAEDGVDDETVRVGDQLRVWRQVQQRRDVGFLALRRQIGVDHVSARRLRVEHRRSVALYTLVSHITLHQPTAVVYLWTDFADWAPLNALKR